MVRLINKVARISNIVFILLFFLLSGCSNSNRQVNTQRLIDLLAEVEKLKLEVEKKQVEKEQLKNQLELLEDKLKEYNDLRNFVKERCP